MAITIFVGRGKVTPKPANKVAKIGTTFHRRSVITPPATVKTPTGYTIADFTARDRIRAALIESFATHMSRSLQQTLYAMGEAALAACADATDITLTMPNRHHLLVDLEPFGLDNPKEVFVATDQPFGLMEATIHRTTA